MGRLSFDSWRGHVFTMAGGLSNHDNAIRTKNETLYSK
jgi:hypothetical protein